MAARKKALLAVSAFFLALIALVSSGILDSLAADGRVDRFVILALITYWALISLALWLLPMLRRRLRQCLLCIASILTALIIAEVALRFVKPYKAMRPFHGQSSTTYHHINPKHAEMYCGIYDGRHVMVRTNEDGLRSKYSRPEFVTYKNRIVMLGDSFTFGFGIREEATFPELTEQLLRVGRKDKDIAILNAGIISYSPFLEEILFSRMLRQYKPTLVLLFLDASDIGDDIVYANEMSQDGTRGVFNVTDEPEIRYYGALWQLAHPHLERVMDNNYLRRAVMSVRFPYDFLAGPVLNRPMVTDEAYEYYDFQLKIDGVVERNRFFIYRHPLQSTRSYFEKTLAYIGNIANETHELGGKFVLVITPRYHHWSMTECPDNWEKTDYSPDDPYQDEYFRFFEEIRGKVDYEILSLLPAFQGTKEFPLVFRNDPHWNEGGHAFVAKAVAKILSQRI